MLATDRRDAQHACQGAADAISFLDGKGLDTSDEIRIRIVERLPSGVEHDALGCYVHPERRVYVLTLREFQLRGEFFGVPASPVLYRSLISHEVAHAIASCNFAIPRPTLAAQEYIAFVTMYATMPQAVRDQMLEAFAEDGFDTEHQISGTMYLIAPQWFGAQSYRHYLKLGNGMLFLRKILAGDALRGDD